MKISELQIQRNIQSINTLSGALTPQSSSFSIDNENNVSQDFSTILESKLQSQSSVNFSNHAKQRIAERNINVDLTRLESGINQVAQKGSANSLVLIDNDAYIVSVKNNTVVTAVDQSSLKNNVFTNIDSVAIV